LTWPTCEIDEDYHRLIPSRFPPVPLYARLGPPQIQAAAEALEVRTNPRLQEMERLAQGERPVSDKNRLQNWNLAPFAYPNPEGTTFLNPAFKILELVKGIRPALAVAVQRREAFLSGSSEPPINIEMRALIHRIKGKFVDVTSLPFESDQAVRRRLGAEIYASEAQGIVFLRPDFPKIRAVAVFDQAVLGRAIQSDHYRFVWDGETVRTIGNFSNEEVIDRDRLFAEFRGKASDCRTSEL
jgi:hypothetical protein